MRKKESPFLKDTACDNEPTEMPPWGMYSSILKGWITDLANSKLTLLY